MAHPRRVDRGYGLLGLLLAVAILGAMAAVVVPLLGSDRGHHGTAAVSPTQTPSANPGGAAADIAAAASIACRAEYQALEAAIAAYLALNGKPPASMSALQSLIPDPATSVRFAITIDPHHPGQIDVAAGGHPAQVGDGNCAYAS